MALHDCPECDKPISTQAEACPHCGCPLRGGQKKRSYLGGLLLVLGLLVVFGSFYDQEDPTARARKAGLENVVIGPRCDAQKAAQLITKAMETGLIHKVDPRTEVSHVYVLEPWQRLTIDDKQTTDNVVQCYMTNGAAKGRTIVVYYDGRSGKELATSDQYGFRME